MGYKPSQADQDVWLRPATTEDDHEYYEYILVYVDDLLHVSHNPDESMQQIMSWVKLKNDHYGEPEIFLGSQLQWKNINGSECWSLQTEDSFTLSGIKYSLIIFCIPIKGGSPSPTS